MRSEGQGSTARSGLYNVPSTPVNATAIAIMGQSHLLSGMAVSPFTSPSCCPPVPTVPLPLLTAFLESPGRDPGWGALGTEQPPASLRPGLFALICSPFSCLSHQRQEHQIRNKVVNSLSKYRSNPSLQLLKSEPWLLGALSGVFPPPAFP